MFDANVFSKKLTQIVNDNDKTIVEVSEDLELENSTLYRYINCEFVPSLETFLKIANYFECRSEYFLEKDALPIKYAFRPCPPFSERFRYYLNKFGDNPRHIERVTEIPNSSMYEWLGGKRQPNIDGVVNLADYFHVSVDDFIGR